MRRNPQPSRRARAHALAAVCLALAGCGSGDRTLLPLDAGRWWYYEVDESVLDERRAQRVLVVNAGPVDAPGGRAWVQRSQRASADYLRPLGAGAERIAHRRPGETLTRDTPPRVLLPEVLEPGAAWSVPSTLGLVESRTFAPADRIIVRRIPVTLHKVIAATDATVEVPAGRFRDCVRVDGRADVVVATDRGNAEAAVEVETREWYAPGVGLVRLERTERSESRFLKTGRQTWRLAEHGD